ncbi:hypothetical protein EVA_14102, partial [gut metagenome]
KQRKLTLRQLNALLSGLSGDSDSRKRAVEAADNQIESFKRDSLMKRTDSAA